MGSQRVRSDMTAQLNTSATQLHNGSIFTTKARKQPRCPPTDEEIWDISIGWNTIWPSKGMKYFNSCYKVVKPWKNYTKWKKPITKGHILWDALMWKFRVGKFIKTRSRSAFVLGLGTGRAMGRCPLVGMDFLNDESVLKLVVVAIWIYKTCWNGYFKRVNCTVFKLYLNRPLLKAIVTSSGPGYFQGSKAPGYSDLLSWWEIPPTLCLLQVVGVKSGTSIVPNTNS